MLIFLHDVISWDVSVTSSVLKLFMKFWGTCFKFWLRPCSKSSSWVVFCCISLWLESRKQWILFDVSWLFRLLYSTTTLSRFTNCCSKESITSSLFFNCSLWNVMSSCNCFVKCYEFSAKTSLPQEISVSF